MDADPPSSFRLRPARVLDLPAILRYERDYVLTIEPEAAPSWVRAIDTNLSLWIACLPTTLMLEVPGSGDTDPAGFVMWQAEAASATLVSVQVGERYRRAGFGTILLRAFEQRAASSGAVVSKLGVHRRNPARVLYERAGYVAVGRDGEYSLFERRLGC